MLEGTEAYKAREAFEASNVDRFADLVSSAKQTTDRSRFTWRFRDGSALTIRVASIFVQTGV